MMFDSQMLPAGFTFETGFGAFKEKYNQLKRPEDEPFDFLQRIADILLADFGGKEDGDLLRYLIHAFYVAGTTQDILIHEDRSKDDLKIGVATAFLHDIGYLLIRDRFQNIFDDFQKKEIRKAHMAAGAEYALKIMAEPPLSAMFAPAERERAAGIIAVHDLPSTAQDDGRKGLPLDLADGLLYAHREADRLWMTEEYGFGDDLRRLQKKKEGTTPKDLLDHVLKRYREEKTLYPDDGGFKGDMLFRTDRGYGILLEQQDKLMAKYAIEP